MRSDDGRSAGATTIYGRIWAADDRKTEKLRLRVKVYKENRARASRGKVGGED